MDICPPSAVSVSADQFPHYDYEPESCLTFKSVKINSLLPYGEYKSQSQVGSQVQLLRVGVDGRRGEAARLQPGPGPARPRHRQVSRLYEILLVPQID